MKLWILKPRDNLPRGDNPWEPWYDKVFGFVVRAESEDIARRLAHESAGEENRYVFRNTQIVNTKKPWLDPKYSICTELMEEGPTGVIMADFQRA